MRIYSLRGVRDDLARACEEAISTDNFTPVAKLGDADILVIDKGPHSIVAIVDTQFTDGLTPSALVVRSVYEVKPEDVVGQIAALGGKVPVPTHPTSARMRPEVHAGNGSGLSGKASNGAARPFKLDHRKGLLAALVVAIAILSAVGSTIYFSPHQSCVRAVMSRDPTGDKNQAEIFCTMNAK